MAEPTQSELIAQAIKSTQELRASVSQVFEILSSGIPKSGNVKASESTFLPQLQQNLVAVNKDLSEIEKAATLLQVTGQINLGNSSLINQDPIIDKTSLYTQVVNTYKWANKLHEYATQSNQLLQPNTLKRTITQGVLGNKRARKLPPPTQPVPNHHVDSLVQQWDKLAPDLSVFALRPFGNPVVLHIRVGKVLQAVVVLRGLNMEWAQVKAFHEEFSTDNGKFDIWSRSEYEVMQKVSDHTNAAMLHFYFPLRQEIAIRSFLNWFHSYATLFSVPCNKCGNYIRDHLPPTWRDFRSRDPYHETCRP